MRTSFEIFLRDLKALGRNPAALLVVIALLVLPGLYAWYCIVANWDPYSNTGNVPIAVVNEDEGRLVRRFCLRIRPKSVRKIYESLEIRESALL